LAAQADKYQYKRKKKSANQKIKEDTNLLYVALCIEDINE
jgi:hypothetical protein